MRLFEHPDFEQIILRAAEHFRPRGLRPAILEKDYYVTEALRIVAGAGEQVIFKGGTSLAKGWNLIERFSEDIDIFLDPRAFKPPLSKRGVDRELTKLRDAIAEHPAFAFIKEESQTIGGPNQLIKSPRRLSLTMYANAVMISSDGDGRKADQNPQAEARIVPAATRR